MSEACFLPHIFAKQMGEWLGKVYSELPNDVKCDVLKLYAAGVDFAKAIDVARAFSKLNKG